MEKHFYLSDADFEQAFESGRLDSALFSHEAHVRLAWIHIRQYGVDRAIENICYQLWAFVNQLNAARKYNKTLTVAAIHAVHHFMKRSQANTCQDFLQEFPRLKSDFRGLMNAHYSFDIYDSGVAKKQYLEPDLLPFD